MNNWLVRLFLTFCYFLFGYYALRNNELFFGGFLMLCAGSSKEKFWEIIRKETEDDK